MTMILICRFCNWEVSSSYKLQLPSAALSIPSSPSPRRHPHFSPRRHQEHQRHQEPLSVSLSLSVSATQLPSAALSIPSSPSPRRHPHFSPRRHQEHQRHQEPLSVSLSVSATQLPSAALSIPSSPSPQVPNSPSPQLPKSPSPKSRRPGGRGRRGARWSPLVLHQQPGPHSFMLPHRGNRLSVVPHRRADRSCGSSTLEADWLQLRTASVKIDLQQPRSEASTWSTCTLNSGWAGLGFAGLGWAGYLLYKA